MSRLRLAFFASGNGTLFETLVSRCRSGDLDAEPVLLICSHEQAPVLERAGRLNVPALVLRKEDYPAANDFALAVLHALRSRQVDLICLTGYLKLVPPEVVQEFRHRLLNIHPALLPAFGGKGMYGQRVHEAVLEYGARLSGATVHLVDEQYDHGPIILQRAVFVLPTDTAETLADRVHAIEYDLYTEAVRLFTQDRIRVNGRRVIILPSPQP
jgi:formyltetrahydrofolate-dependent phosphoribosylglycinamide formyltransferase